EVDGRVGEPEVVPLRDHLGMGRVHGVGDGLRVGGGGGAGEGGGEDELLVHGDLLWVRVPVDTGSDDPRGLVEGQARGTGEQGRGVAVAQVDQQVGTYAGTGEERGIDGRGVEAGHRAGIQAQRAGGQDQVGALQAGV